MLGAARGNNDHDASGCWLCLVPPPAEDESSCLLPCGRPSFGTDTSTDSYPHVQEHAYLRLANGAHVFADDAFLALHSRGKQVLLVPPVLLLMQLPCVCLRWRGSAAGANAADDASLRFQP